MTASWEMLRGYKWSMFGMGVLLGLINMLGALCLGVGVFFTAPMSAVATVIFYEKINTGQVR